MDFVMLANDWQSGVDNPTSKHRIAVELARQGHRVLWLEGAGLRRPALRGTNGGADRSRIVRKLKRACSGVHTQQPGIWSLGPFALPFPHSEWSYRFNNAFFRLAALRACRRLHFQQPVLVNYVPTFDRLMLAWPGNVIYHCVDRWDAFDAYDSQLMSRRNAACCRHADLVLATSQDLVNRCRENMSSRVELLSHGVDHAHFRGALQAGQRPPDLPPSPIAGFFGLLSSWVDQDLLIRLADSLPEPAAVVLIGKADTDVSRLERHPRIHLLGPRPFTDLPRYIAHFAVGLIPFQINELTVAVNPIKLREMLAAGCPVVSTALPEVALYDHVADVCASPDDFVAAAIRYCHCPMTASARATLSNAVSSETWEAKVRDLVAHATCLIKRTATDTAVYAPL